MEAYLYNARTISTQADFFQKFLGKNSVNDEDNYSNEATLFGVRYDPDEASSAAVAPIIAEVLPGKNESYDDIITRAAKLHGVDAALIKAVVSAESGFSKRAVSPVGAQGLMQLMPATASGLGVKNAFDPEQNIMGGTKYLKQMLADFKGNLDNALAAYNWGPGNMASWLRTGRGVKGQLMPNETKNYMTKVKKLKAQYSPQETRQFEERASLSYKVLDTLLEINRRVYGEHKIYE
jgi:soluble lytic murein transglycosylase-like protein